MKKICIIIAFVLLCHTACSGAILNDIWNDITKDRTVRLGMTKEEVIDLWGEPDIAYYSQWTYVWSQRSPIGAYIITSDIGFDLGVVIALDRQKEFIRGEYRKIITSRKLMDENKRR